MARRSDKSFDSRYLELARLILLREWTEMTTPVEKQSMADGLAAAIGRAVEDWFDRNG